MTLDFLPLPIPQCHDTLKLQNVGHMPVAEELHDCYNTAGSSGGRMGKEKWEVELGISVSIKLYHLKHFLKIFLRRSPSSLHVSHDFFAVSSIQLRNGNMLSGGTQFALHHELQKKVQKTLIGYSLL